MKAKLLRLLLVFFVTLNASAQVPKYVLFEHFTNTNCGVCGATNPGFYQNININTNTKLHHLSIHSSIPYSSCIFYQANRVPQDERAVFYGLSGTPRVSINGANTVNAGSISTAHIDNAYCANCSPIELRVTEVNNSVNNRTANIRVRSVGIPPTGNFKLYVAVAEKTVNYNAPNGENVHHNIFRQFLTSSSGDALVLAAKGSETALNLNYTLNPNWTASEIYVVSWLQNEATREVVNSGTKFDALVIPIELSQWSGKAVGADNQLTWTTLTETNTDFFEIERSLDGKNFISIGRQKAAGDSKVVQEYTFWDKNNLKATPQYYRLKTVDLDGQVSFSNTITIAKRDEKNGQFTLFPNPVTNILKYKFNQVQTEASEFTLFDILGHIVLNEKLNDTEGVISISHLPKGTYFVRLKTTGELLYEKIILE